MKLVTASEMRECDRVAIEDVGIPALCLMENAGRSVVEAVEELLPRTAPRKVAVLCGPGNNGGDGMVVARHLRNRGVEVKVYLLARAEKLSHDARVQHEILGKMGFEVAQIESEAELEDLRPTLVHQHCIVDALLGTGLSSEVRGLMGEAIEVLNAIENVPVVAVDIPSGLDADSGRPLGRCVKAERTVTFAHLKRGLALYPGADFAGRVTVADIGIPVEVVEELGVSCELLTEEDVRPLLPRRRPDAHKGTFGHLLVLAGSPGKTGAAMMTGDTAMRTGAGLVTVATTREALRIIESHSVEVMCQALTAHEDEPMSERAFDAFKALLPGKTALAIGPGLTQNEDIGSLVVKILGEVDLPAVIDADGLNVLVGRLDALSEAGGDLILTPHPGEMARLLGCDTAGVQRDRIGTASEFAGRHGVILVLKGARTVVAHPNGAVALNPTGNAGMASGGMGDVLTGLIGSLLAQGLKPWDAARAGAYLHGLAGDRACEEKGEAGLVATDLINILPAILWDWGY